MVVYVLAVYWIFVFFFLFLQSHEKWKFPVMTKLTHPMHNMVPYEMHPIAIKVSLLVLNRKLLLNSIYYILFWILAVLNKCDWFDKELVIFRGFLDYH
jgi:hypothetical protein